jgi:WS/DGAT/MGAT family acyltransferase
VTNPDRLSQLDADLLRREDASSLQAHVASVLIFDGPAPSIDELTDQVVARLDLVPRYRQKLAEVPYGLGRPVWIDDDHFNPGYHVRHAALPRPGDRAVLARLAGRLCSQRLDPTKPLWEVWLVEGLADDRFAVVGKTHHVLVDGVKHLDLTTVLFDAEPDPEPTDLGGPQLWVARPAPSRAQLLAGAAIDRTSDPAASVQELVRLPLALADGVRRKLPLAFLHDDPPARTRLNVPIGPHRRYAWVEADLDRFRRIKTALGGTVNDVVLTAVAGALGRYLRACGDDTDGLVLCAQLPVWTPSADPSRRTGRVEMISVPLPVGVVDPRDRFRLVSESLDGLKETGRAVEAGILTELAGFAPSTIISQAARLQARSGGANLTVTNVPGPQAPLFLLGRQLQMIYPVVPLADRQALGVAVMSYCGRLGFGLLADHDAVPDVELIATELEAAIDELDALAGAAARPRRSRRVDGRPAPPRAAGARRR